MSETVIVILSDPDNGGEDALGRVFNGFATAYEIKQAGGEVAILFQGTGTRWPGHLSKPDHPLHGLFEQVKDDIVGVSSGCADFFGAAEEASASGFKLIKENLVPGTSGLPSIWRLQNSGAAILTF